MERFWYFSSIILCIIVSIFYIYYKQYIIHKPILSANKGYKELLLAKCPVLKNKYHPTFWCYEARCQTVVGTVFKPIPSTNSYSKEVLQLQDGGQVGLDWVYNDGNKIYKNEAERPTVIYLPGITGDSESSYFFNFVKEATALGYRSVVFNNRGQGGAEFKTPRAYSGANTEDVSAVIKHVKTKYPTSPLIATGVAVHELYSTYLMDCSAPGYSSISEIVFTSTVQYFNLDLLLVISDNHITDIPFCYRSILKKLNSRNNPTCSKVPICEQVMCDASEHIKNVPFNEKTSENLHHFNDVTVPTRVVIEYGKMKFTLIVQPGYMALTITLAIGLILVINDLRKRLKKIVNYLKIIVEGDYAEACIQEPIHPALPIRSRRNCRKPTVAGQIAPVRIVPEHIPESNIAKRVAQRRRGVIHK